MERRPALSDAEIASWLSAPGGEPPFGIVTRVVSRTARIRQRPAAIVTLLGVPSAGSRQTALPPSRQIAFVLVAAALIVAIVGIAVGSGRTDQLPRPSALASQPVTSPPPTNRPAPSVEPTGIPHGTVIRSIPVDRMGVYLPVPDDAQTFVALHTWAKVDGWVVTMGDGSNGAGIEGGLGRPSWSVNVADVSTVIAKISALPDVQVEDIGPITVDSEQGRLVWLLGARIGVSVEQIRPLAIIEHADRLYLVRPEDSTGKRASAISDLTAFVQRFEFIDPATYRGDRLTLTMPDSWQVTTKGSITTIHQGDGIFFAVDYRIRSYPLGSKIEIQRGDGVDPVAITGRNLEQLRASIETALPGAADRRWPLLVDGAKGYRFVVRQAAIHEPLTQLAVIVVGDRIVVVTDTFRLDGNPDTESFSGMLDSLKFER